MSPSTTLATAFSISFFSLLSILSSSQKLPATFLQSVNDNVQEHSMIVFIHGTLMTPQRLKTFLGNESNSKKNQHSTFVTSSKRLGLEKILPYTPPKNSDFSPHKLTINSHAYDVLCSMTENFKLQARSYYAFNWDGKLSEKSRIYWADKLYDALLKEQERLENIHKTSIKITLIGHSFGGRIAANLGAVEKRKRRNICIDYLVNLGTPVQRELISLLSSPIFKKTYHIFSNQDYIQIAGTLSSQGLNASRLIRPTSHKKMLPPNLTQIDLRIDKTAPHHQEFWLLATSPVFYRESLSLYPFPVLSYLPLILDGSLQHCSTEKHLIVTLSKNSTVCKVHITDGHRKHKGTSLYPLSSTWKLFHEEQVNFINPLVMKIKNKLRKYAFFSSIFLVAEFVRRRLKRNEPATV